MKTKLSQKTIITIIILFFSITVVQNIKAQVTLDWVTQIGGTGGEEGHSIVADSLGNTYVLGTYPSGTNLLDFDNGPGTLTLPVGNGFTTAFLAKFDVNGNLLWVNSVIDNNSTTSNDYIYPQELTIDNNNNIIVFGSLTGSVDADPGAVVSMISNPNSEAVFVSKFSSLGNLIWATTAAYSTSNLSGIDPQSVDVDSQGNIFLTGIFRRTIQFTATDSITSVNNVNLSLYVIKLDPSGNFLWAKTPNTSSSQNQYSIGYSIHLDNSDNVMITGYYYGDVDFDLGAGVHVVTSTASFPNSDLFVLKLDNNGNFIWVKNYGNANGRLLGIDVNTDATGNIIIAGALSGFNTALTDIDPSTATLNINNGVGYESFVLKLDASGNNIWVKNIAANTAQTELFNVATDNCGNIYSIGRFKGTCDFDPGPAVFNMTSGFQNIFISKLDSSGNFVWAHNFGEGSTFADKDNDIFIGNNSSVYFTAGMGIFTSTTSPAADFNPGTGTQMLTTNGYSDIVVAKLIDCCLPTVAPPINFIGTTTFCSGDSIILNAGAGYSNYQWIPTNDTTQSITVSSSGNYAVIISDNCGTDTSQTVTITVNQSSSFNQIFTECSGFSVTVGSNTYNSSGTFVDSLFTNTGCDSIVTTNLTITTPNTTTQTFNECDGFSVTVGTNTYNSSGVYTDVVNTCDTMITNLTINPKPIVNLINNITITQGSSITLSASGGGTYNWSPPTNLSCTDCSTPVANPLFSTTYCVNVTASNGCADTQCVNVNVDVQCGELFVPNVFSPNGDGNNDKLEVKINPTCVKSFNIQIFDRWGEKVFESDDINNSWNGTYKGKPLNGAVFVYHLNILLINSETSISKKGNISIIR